MSERDTVKPLVVTSPVPAACDRSKRRRVTQPYFERVTENAAEAQETTDPATNDADEAPPVSGTRSTESAVLGRYAFIYGTEDKKVSS